MHQSDGKWIVAGTADGPIAATMFAARFTASGVLDATYGTGGIAYVDIPSDLGSMDAEAAAIDANGNLVLAGTSLTSQPYVYDTNVTVVRLLPTGAPDPTFGSGGLVRPAIPGYSGLQTGATVVAIDSLGRIVVGGGAHDSMAGDGGFLVLRLTPSGGLDKGFNSTGYRILNLSQFTYPATSLCLTSTDGVFVAGYDDLSSSTPFAIAKLAPDGAFDTTFGGTGVVHVAGGDSIALDAAGNVLFGSPSSFPVLAVTRYTPAGAVDPSFGVGGTAQISLGSLLLNLGAGAIRVDGKGRIVLAVGGTTLTGAGFAALRFAANGSVDTSFGVSGVQVVSTGQFFQPGAVLDVGQDDDLAVAGGGNQSVFVSHLTAAGAVDTGFNGTGTLIQPFGAQTLTMTGMVKQADGRLVILGYAGAAYAVPGGNFVVARLTAAGALDPTFNGTGFRVIDTAEPQPINNSIALDGNGRIVMSSRDSLNNFRVVRLSSDGTLDSTFNGTGTVSVADSPSSDYHGAQGLAVDSHGNIFLAGRSLIRIDSTGIVDSTFGNGGRVPIPLDVPQYVRIPIAADSADRPVIGGMAPNGTSHTFAVARHTTSGALDPTFGNGGVLPVPMGAEILDAGISALALDGSGRILLAGPASTTSGGVTAVARVTAAGAPDPSFNGTGVSTFPGFIANPGALAVDPVGRIVVTGSVSNNGRGYTARLTSNGAIDASFNATLPVITTIAPGSTPLSTTAVVAAADGIYVGGTGGRSMAVVKLFDGAPTKLAIFTADGGGSVVAATPFDMTVQSQDAVGNPQPVATATSVAISLNSGTGTILGPTTCTIPARQTSCTIAGVTYSTFGYLELAAAVTSGDPLASALSGTLPSRAAQLTVAITSHTPDPSAFGQAVTVTVSVAAPAAIVAPTGQVNVSDGVSSCSIVLPASSCDFYPAVAGTRMLVAEYLGDRAFNFADSVPVAHSVTAATTFSGPTATGAGIATAAFTGGGPGCTFANPQFVSQPPLPIPPGTSFPYGYFNFSVLGCTPGASIVMTITYPGPLPATAGYQMAALNFLGQPLDWFAVPGISVSGNTIAFTLTDGDPGIHDSTRDGSIVSRGGVAVPLAPTLLSAASRRVHGGAGTFNLPLSLAPATPTTEPRQGPAQTIVLTFDRPIAGATVSIAEGTAAAAAPIFSGNDVIVGLTGVTNTQYVTISLTDVASTDGTTGGSGSVRVGFLFGDVNQSQVVTFSDLVLANAQLTKPVTVLNFLKDVNASGSLTFSDLMLINANLGKALPNP